MNTNNINNKSYLELFNHFQNLNKENNYILSDEIIFEFIYDSLVYNKETFLNNRNKKSENNKIKLNNFLKCLNQKIPWERVLKYSYFFGMKFILLDNVFSPRFETEFLVNEIIKDLNNKNHELTFYDLGSGTGCINIVLSKFFKNSNFINFENNISAYENSVKNINLYKLENIKTIKTNYLDWLKNNEIKANIIVCNPPYIKEDFQLDQEVLFYDPKSALFASDNGLFYYKEILNILIKKQPLNLNSIYFEIGYDQKNELEAFLISQKINNYEFIKDLNNHYRVLKIIFN